MAGPFVNRAHDKHARHTVVRGNVRSHVRSGDEWCTTIHSNLFDLRSHVAERDGGEEKRCGMWAKEEGDWSRKEGWSVIMVARGRWRIRVVKWRTDRRADETYT